MTPLEQRQAFGDELSALCIRYIREFDIKADDLILVLAAEIRVLIEAKEAVLQESESPDDMSM